MATRFDPADLARLAPELVLTAGLLVVLMAQVVLRRDRQNLLGPLSVATLVATGLTLLAWDGTPATAFAGLLAVDGFAVFFKVVFLAAAAITILMSGPFLAATNVRPGDYYFLVLTATLGMMVMAASIDLISLFIGLEAMAVSFYILTGMLKPSRRSNEAAMKYFVLGTFSLAVLLYGMSLLYGLTGTTRLRDIAVAVAADGVSGGLVVAVVLIIAGMGFKIAAVPFHMWAPDVYEGAPTPITAFLSVGSKAASFAMLLRLIFEGVPMLGDEWRIVFYVLSVLTMTVGNIAALTQTNVKRLLAYSSIAHAGYVLMGLVAGTPRGIAATLIYLAIYLFMQLGAFAVVIAIKRTRAGGEEMKDFAGLFARQPGLAIAMLIFMLSLGGIPPTAGFMGKLWLFSAVIESGYVWLAVIGVLNSALSLYYYLRIVVFMFMKADAEPAVAVRPGPALATALAVALIGTVLFGIYPRALFDLATPSALDLGRTPPALTTTK